MQVRSFELKTSYLKIIKGVFGLAIFITHISVFIAHNSKMVGPIAKRLFGKSITLFL